MKFITILANGVRRLHDLAFADISSGAPSDNALLREALLECDHALFSTMYSVPVVNATDFVVATTTIHAGCLRFGDLLNIKGFFNFTASTNAKNIKLRFSQDGVSYVVDSVTPSASTANVRIERDVQVSATSFRSWTSSTSNDFSYAPTWGLAEFFLSCSKDIVVDYVVTAPPTETVTFSYGSIALVRKPKFI